MLAIPPQKDNGFGIAKLWPKVTEQSRALKKVVTNLLPLY